MSRSYPNIIVTGTPGCGKTSHAKALSAALGEPYRHYNISEVAKDKDFIESYDKVLDTSVVDEDKLLDYMEVEMAKGGAIVDWHVCDIFPERLVDLVVVLRCDNSVLHDRLTARGYKDNKIQENIDAEIMEVILQEARDAYVPEIVVVLNSETDEDKTSNLDRLESWVKNWIEDHPQGTDGTKVGKSESESEEESDDDFEGEEEESEEESEEEAEEEETPEEQTSESESESQPKKKHKSK